MPCMLCLEYININTKMFFINVCQGLFEIMFWLQLYFEELFNRTTVESLVKIDILNEITTLVSFDKINTHTK